VSIVRRSRPIADKTAESRRDALIAAATALFSRYGFRRTTMERIAEEAGTAKATAYSYFPGKEEAFRAVCERLAEKLIAVAEADRASRRPCKPRLAAMLTHKFVEIYELVHRSPHAREILESSDRIASEIFRDAHDRFVTLLAEVLGELRQRPPSRAEREVAELLDDAAEGIAQRANSARDVEQRLTRLVNLIVDGHARRAPH
jgi:AcrR family transcriptional regulator